MHKGFKMHFKNVSMLIVLIRYEFLIDNMPLNNVDLPELDHQQKRRLETMAKTKKIKDI